MELQDSKFLFYCGNFVHSYYFADVCDAAWQSSRDSLIISSFTLSALLSLIISGIALLIGKHSTSTIIICWWILNRRDVLCALCIIPHAFWESIGALRV